MRDLDPAETLPGASHGSLHQGEDGSYGGAPEDFLASSRLRNLILAKEKELHDINQFRIDTLEQMLHERDRVIAELGDKMRKLKEDFHYNLALIEERDAELERYDATFSNLKEGLREKDKEISDLKIGLSELEARAKLQASRHADSDASYQTRLKEMQDEVELLRAAHEEEARRRRAEAEGMRFDLEHKVREKEEEMEAQRRELTMGFDEVLQQREAETRAKEDELLAQLRQLEREVGLKNRALEKAQGHERVAQEQNARIGALAQENQELQAQVTRLVAEHEEKMAELLDTLHQVEQAFVAQKAEAEAERARLESAHEERLRAAVSKRDAKIDALKEAVGRSEERAKELDMALQEARREGEDKLAIKAREMGAQEEHFAAELERKESELLALKSQLWNAEAELNQAKIRVTDLTSLSEERLRDAARFREQAQQLRQAMDDMNKDSLGRIEELRREVEARDSQHKRLHEEALGAAMAQAEAANAEAESLRRRVVALEAELLRRQERIADLAEVESRLERQLAALKQSRPLQERSAASPLFSEDLGPASPLERSRLGAPGAGADRGLGEPRYREEQWSPVRGGVEEALEAENRRLRAVISDMRHEVEGLRAVAPQQAQGGDHHHQHFLHPPNPAPALGPAAEEEVRERGRLAHENKKLREDNKRLMGTCDKLMEISNELNARFNKLSAWMAQDPSSLPPLPPTEAGGREAAAGGDHHAFADSLEHGRAAPPPPPPQGEEQWPQPLPRPRHDGAEVESGGRQRLEQLRDEMLLTGGAVLASGVAPKGLAPKASDRATKTQKKVASKLKAQQASAKAAGAGAGAPSRAEMLQQRQRIRNYNRRDDDL